MPRARAIVLALLLAAALARLEAAEARIQPQMFCWDPDFEFPVACDEDEEADDDDDEARQAVRRSLLAIRPVGG